MIVTIGKTSLKKWGSFLTLYLCYCGRGFLSLKYPVDAGKTKSCGCSSRTRSAAFCKSAKIARKFSDPTEGAFRKLFRGYVNNCIKVGRVFELTPEDFRLITKKNCYYCLVVPKQEIRAGYNSSAPYVYNGIDRKDNLMGYMLSNCIPCCAKCNYMKGTLGQDVFICHILTIAAAIVKQRLND